MYPQFHDPMLSMSLGPVIRPEPPKPEPHLVHDWRPIEGQPDHVKCIGCGAVALREYVMPPAAFGVDLAAGVDKTVVLHRGAEAQTPGYPSPEEMREFYKHAALDRLNDGEHEAWEAQLLQARRGLAPSRPDIARQMNAQATRRMDRLALQPPAYPPSVFSDSVLEQIRREDAFAREHRTWFYVCKPVEDDDL